MPRCRRPRPLPLPRLAMLLLAPVLACGGDDPAGPSDDGAFPLEWNFDSGLDGWQAGTRTTGDGGGDVVAANGAAVLSGFGAPGTPDAWISRTIELPPEPMSLAFTARAGCTDTNDGDSALSVMVTSPDWQGEPELAAELVPTEQETSFLLGLNPYAGMTVTITFAQDDEGEQESAIGFAESICIDDIVISDLPAKTLRELP